MNLDVASLEAKVERVAEFCEELRAQNHALRERIADLEKEKADLAARMTNARERLETLMDKLPGE